MQGDFEKEVSRRLKELNISPPPELWQRVEAALPPEKRRRRVAFWWWLLPLVGCLGTAIWLTADYKTGTSNGDPTSAKQLVTNNKVPPQTASVTPSDTFTSSTTNPAAQRYTKKTITGKADSANGVTVVAKQVATVTFKPARTVAAIIKITPAPLHPVNTYLPVPNSTLIKEPVLSGSDSAGHEIQLSLLKNQPKKEWGNATGEKVASPEKRNEDSPLLPKESVAVSTNTITGLLIPDQPTDTAVSVKKDSLALVQFPPKKKSADNKRKTIEWIATAALGKSQLTKIESNSSLRYYDALYSNNSTSSQGNYRPPFSQPETGFSFSTGITRRQYFLTHWSWQLGLHYVLLTSSQLTGSKNDTLASNRLEKSLSEVYATGSSATYHSRMHQIQLSPGIGYTINPAGNLSISFFAGGSVAYNLGSNLLLHDYRYYSYVRSATYSNKWFISTNAGLDVSIRHKVHIGLLYEYGYTNVAKPVLQSNFHWRQIQLHAGISIFNHPKK